MRFAIKTHALITLPVAALLGLSGCSSSGPRGDAPALPARGFQSTVNGDPAPNRDAADVIPGRTPPPTDRGTGGQPPRSVAPVVDRQVRPPGGEVSLDTPTATAPASRPATSASSGTYITLGGVVAEVGATPIFAHKVMTVLREPLAANAPNMNDKQFRAFARDILGREVQNFIRAELEYEAASRHLNDDDKKLADASTIQWRKKKITEAGGSVEVARRRAAAEGFDFDDMVDQQHKLEVTKIYYTRKLIPRIQISASDIRAYYNRNADSEFTEHGQVRFRLIKVDPRTVGGKDAALAKAKNIQERAARGEDFATMARQENSDKALAEQGGDFGWIGRGMKLKQLEAAIWSAQVGDVTPVVQEGDLFYVARLEERKKGVVHSFEEQAVQEKIRQTLHAEQFRALREAAQEELLKKNVWTINRDMMNTMLEMAVQMYKKA